MNRGSSFALELLPEAAGLQIRQRLPYRASPSVNIASWRRTRPCVAQPSLEIPLSHATYFRSSIWSGRFISRTRTPATANGDGPCRRSRPSPEHSNTRYALRGNHLYQRPLLSRSSSSATSVQELRYPES